MSFISWLNCHATDSGIVGEVAQAMKSEFEQWQAANSRGGLFQPEDWDVPCLPWRDSKSWIRRHITLRNDLKLLTKFYMTWNIYRRSLGKKSRQPRNLNRRMKRSEVIKCQSIQN